MIRVIEEREEKEERIHRNREAFANLDPVYFVREMIGDDTSGFICDEMGSWIRHCYADFVGKRAKDPYKSIRMLHVYRGAGKTSVATQLGIAWVLLLRPNASIALFSKKIEMATNILSEIGKTIESSPYINLFNEIYESSHKTLLTINKREEKSMELKMFTRKGKAPSLTSLGVNSTVTGCHFDLIVSDDIVSSDDFVSDADRFRARRMVEEVYLNVCNKGGSCVYIGTPHHPSDVYSYIKEQFGYGHDYAFMKYKLGDLSKDNTKEDYERIRKDAFAAGGEDAFNKHYLLNPSVSTQSAPFANIQRGDLNENRDYENMGKIIAAIDPAYAGLDNTAVVILFKLKSSEKIYFLGKLWIENALTVADHIVDFLIQYRATKVFIENNKDEGYLIDTVKRECAKRRYTASIVPKRNMASKQTRIYGAISPRLDDLYMLEKECDKEFVRQIKDWTSTSTCDDAPDALALGLKEGFGLKRRGSGFFATYLPDEIPFM